MTAWLVARGSDVINKVAVEGLLEKVAFELRLNDRRVCGGNG